MTISFSTNALQKTVNILNANKRDIQNDDLASYYQIDRSAQTNLGDRYDTVQQFREANNLDSVSEASFVASTSPGGGQTFFEKLVIGSGIEATFQEDLVEQSALVQAPPSVSSFITKESRKFALDTANLENTLKFSQRSPTKHLLEDAARFVGDSDTEVFRRLKNSQQYIRDLIK